MAELGGGGGELWPSSTVTPSVTSSILVLFFQSRPGCHSSEALFSMAKVRLT